MALTALTVAVIGVVVVTLTPMGCGPTHALGMKAKGDRCANRAAAESPFPSAKPGYVPPPYSPPAYSPPPSPPPPTSSPSPPDSGPNSGAYPPYFPPSSPGGVFTPALSLSCRLPVYAGGSGSGGFIVFPGGTFTADPASAVSLPAGAPTPAPMGMGQMGYYGSLSYDRAFSKWLPVPLTWVSPDGSRYAFPAGNSIWVQNVADSGHVVLGDGQQLWVIVAFLSDGVYVSGPNSPGLWLLPLAGAPRQIATTGFWRAAAAGAAYGTATSAVPQGASNPILKLDLKTGAITDWFNRGNSQANVLGFDAQGHPVIQVYYQAPPGGMETWLTTGPSTGVPLGGSSSPPAAGQPPQLNSTPLGDGHGVWFQATAQYPTPPASTSGMVLYVAGSGTYWMSNISGQVAGGCG